MPFIPSKTLKKTAKRKNKNRSLPRIFSSRPKMTARISAFRTAELLVQETKLKELMRNKSLLELTKEYLYTPRKDSASLKTRINQIIKLELEKQFNAKRIDSLCFDFKKSLFNPSANVSRKAQNLLVEIKGKKGLISVLEEFLSSAKPKKVASEAALSETKRMVCEELSILYIEAGKSFCTELNKKLEKSEAYLEKFVK